MFVLRTLKEPVKKVELDSVPIHHQLMIQMLVEQVVHLKLKLLIVWHLNVHVSTVFFIFCKRDVTKIGGSRHTGEFQEENKHHLHIIITKDYGF